jgi:hypothetical protein
MASAHRRCLVVLLAAHIHHRDGRTADDEDGDDHRENGLPVRFDAAVHVLQGVGHLVVFQLVTFGSFHGWMRSPVANT